MSESAQSEWITSMDEMATPEKMERVASTLNIMSNPYRLKILCLLLRHGEQNVGQLLNEIDLAQSPLSQHLARLRKEGIVETRKEKQSVFYRIARDDIEAIMQVLYRLYCETEG